MSRALQTFLIGSLCAAMLAGCSGVSPTQVGQAAGGIAGGLLVPGIGTQIGALVGTLAGLVVEGQVDKSREQKERVELGRQLTTGPTLPATLLSTLPLAGPLTRVWVDEQFHNGRLLAGHFDARAIP